MCGICGFTGFNNDALLEKMCEAIAHRGPDDHGTFIDRDHLVSLGHRRLSIIDIEGGKQPMFNEDQTVAIVYNGEIYNFLELRKFLVSKGHIFTTRSDTEVLIHLYEEYGNGMLQKINGIFAFVIYDMKKKILFGVRDHFGVKPLYYFCRGRRFLFGSEAKAILEDRSFNRRLNFEALHYSLNLRYVPGKLTMFEDIYKLPAGHYLIYDLEKSALSLNRYRVVPRHTNPRLKPPEAMEGIRHYLGQAVKRQLISDVPLGAYLSGGLDSSAIVAYASSERESLKTLSLGFNEPTDEVDDAKKTSEYFGSQFCSTFIDPDPLKNMKRVLWHLEEPKVNMLQGYFLSKFARKHVKVALSGLGGDELFAGYTNNQFLYPMNFLHNFLPGEKSFFQSLSTKLLSLEGNHGSLKLNEIRRGLQMLFSYGDRAKFYLILRNVWDYDAPFYNLIYSKKYRDSMKNYRTETIFRDYFRSKSESIVDQSLNAEFNLKLVDDFLTNEDRTSMANGLEVRVPFLDKDLVEFAFSIPYEMKMKHNRTRDIYKKSMRGVLPEFTFHKKKWGFGINPFYQFKKDLRRVALDTLTRKKIEEQGIFNYSFIERILETPPSPRLRWHYFYLWQLIGFQYWYDMFIENDLTGFDL